MTPSPGQWIQWAAVDDARERRVGYRVSVTR
jgi:hypothetical protein